MNTNQADATVPAIRTPDSLLAMFANLGEQETYRLLADLLADLSERRGGGGDGQGGEQLKEVSRKLATIQKDKADLEFKLQTAEADLRDREERLGLELARIKDLDARVKDQQSRLSAVEKTRADLEAQLTARSTELHAAELDKEALLLKAQRSAAAAEDRKEAQALEQDNKQLRQQLDALRAELEAARVEKNTRISQLEAELRKAQEAGATAAGDGGLAPLWDRLAKARLAPGGVAPSAPAGQRLADAFVDMAAFVGDLDDALRRLLPKYTKRVKPLSMVWQGYAAGESFQQVIAKLLDPASGASLSGILRMKLKVCAKWANAALIGSDAALEFIESELRNRLQEFNRGRGNRASVADFLAGSGHEEFQARMAQLHSDKVAELFQSGA